VATLFYFPFKTDMTTNSPNLDGIYQPLDRTRREIRILQFHFPVSKEVINILNSNDDTNKIPDRMEDFPSPFFPDDSDDDDHDPIHAQLVTVSLLDKPAYIALPYT